MIPVKQMAKCPHCGKFSAHPGAQQATQEQAAVANVRAKMRTFTKPEAKVQQAMKKAGKKY